MYTKFGEYVRVLRIQRHEIMGDMADKLGTTTPFLSAVENGRKNVPKEWLDKLVKLYSLNKEEANNLKEAIEESKLQTKIDLRATTTTKKQAALKFARSFDDIDDETAEKIIQLLERRKK